MEQRKRSFASRIALILRAYLMEVNFLKGYILTILVTLLFCFSLYLVLGETAMAWIGDEDKFFEWLTSLSFLASAVLCFMFFTRKKNMFFLLLGLAFFLGFGEEISWGQRLIGYGTPESLLAINVQKEFNFHNIMTWEVNFIFKVFTLGFGIVLPLIVFHFRGISQLTARFRLPVPPVTLGIFFLLDWFVFKLTVTMLPQGFTPKYYFSATEIYEFITSFILVLIFYFFYVNRNKMIQGVDIKDQLVVETESLSLVEKQPKFKTQSTPVAKVPERELTY